MACDTFIKIANKCRRHFVSHQAGETEPFIDEIVRSLRRITEDLGPQQIHTFYEACGYMISAQGQKSIQERLIVDLMSIPNQAVSIIFNSNVFCCSTNSDAPIVGSNYLAGERQPRRLARWRDYQGHWQHHENQCRCLLLYWTLLLSPDRPHLPGHVSHVSGQQ